MELSKTVIPPGLPSDARQTLIEELDRYVEVWDEMIPSSPDWSEQRKLAMNFRHLVCDKIDCAERTCLPGHLTASVLITTPDCEQVLLTHHRKLGLWLQLGGHADGECELWRVALREGEEESGLTDLTFPKFKRVIDNSKRETPLIFDLDRHWIPERKTEPGHYHYDVRYVAVTQRPESIAISDESADLRWFSLEDAYPTNEQWSMHRQFDKLKFLIKSW